MLQGRRIGLRPVRRSDLDSLLRGSYRHPVPRQLLRRQSESAFLREFEENGVWQKTEGMLLIRTPEDELAGHIEFFRPVSYWDAFELSYQLYDAATRAVAMRPRRSSCSSTTSSRQEGTPHPRGHRSRERGFAAHRERSVHPQGTVRGAFFNDGRNQDVLLYSLLRTDPRPWHDRNTGD